MEFNSYPSAVPCRKLAKSTRVKASGRQPGGNAFLGGDFWSKLGLLYDTVHVARPGTYRIKALYAFQTNTVSFELNGKPAATCRLPVPTANYHQWNLAEIGTLHFPEAGPQLLTFHYGKGNNFAYFEFEPIASASTAKP